MVQLPADEHWFTTNPLSGLKSSHVASNGSVPFETEVNKLQSVVLSDWTWLKFVLTSRRLLPCATLMMSISSELSSEHEMISCFDWPRFCTHTTAIRCIEESIVKTHRLRPATEPCTKATAWKLLGRIILSSLKCKNKLRIKDRISQPIWPGATARPRRSASGQTILQSPQYFVWLPIVRNRTVSRVML